MTVAFDVATTKAETTGDSTWSHTAASSGVKGALVFIVIRASNTPPVGVTYGGTAMAKIAEANDTANEIGNATAWALHASIPQGTQTVSVDVGAAQVWGGAAVSVTGAVDTKSFTATQAENAANPSQAVTVPASYVNYSAAALFSGLAAPSSVTAGTNYTLVGAGVDFSGGGVSDCAVFERLTTGTTTGDPTVAFTSATDDVAFVAVAIGEVQAFTSAHTGPNLALNAGTHAISVGRFIAETSATFTFAGGTHTRTSTRAATAGNLQLAGGTHALTVARTHVAANLTLEGGTHTSLKAQYVTYTAGSLALAGGTHVLTLTRQHDAGQLSFTGGTHALSTTRQATGAELALQGGDHTADYVPGASGSRARVSWVQIEVPLGTPGVDNTVSHTAPNLALAGGAAALALIRQHTAGEIALAGGTHSFTVTRAATAAELSFAGGSHTASAGHYATASAAQFALAGGSHAITVLRRLSAGDLSLSGGSQHLSITRQHTAGQVSLGGGDSNAAHGLQIAHLAAELALNGGSANLSLTRSLTSAQFGLHGGASTLLIRRNVDAELGDIAGPNPNGSLGGPSPNGSISEGPRTGQLVSVGDATRGHAHDHGGLGGDVH